MSHHWLPAQAHSQQPRESHSWQAECYCNCHCPANHELGLEQQQEQQQAHCQHLSQDQKLELSSQLPMDTGGLHRTLDTVSSLAWRQFL